MTTTVFPERVIDPIASAEALAERRARSENVWARAMRSGRVVLGGGLLLIIVLFCLTTLVLTLSRSSAYYYDKQASELSRLPPKAWPPTAWYGYDALGRSIVARCLLGGTISMGVGLAAATIAVVIGVTVGL